MANMQAREPPSPWRPWEACLLVSCPMHDPIMEETGKAMPGVWHPRAPKPRWLGACLLAPGPWLALQARQEPRPNLGHVIDREPKAQSSPCALCRSMSCLGSARFLGRRVHASIPDRYSP